MTKPRGIGKGRPRLLLPMGRYTETDLAYLAGLFDGEGDVIIRQARLRSGSLAHSVRISISNSHRPTLEWVKAFFGGGEITPCAGAVNYRVWRLPWGVLELHRLLPLLLPYLHIRTREVELAIRFSNLKAQQGGRPNTPALLYEKGQIIEDLRKARQGGRELVGTPTRSS